jgi:hypothetical protein
MNKPFKNKAPETQFWNEVEAKSQNLIASLIEKTLPISATPQVFKLEKDPDYRTLLNNDLPNYYQESEEYQETIAHQSWTEEDVEVVSENLACEYFAIVVKNLSDWLSRFYGFENSRLAQLSYDY